MVNILEKLKHCTKGTKLYSPLIGEVTFCCIDTTDELCIVCECVDEDGSKSNISFDKFGRYFIEYKSECLLFPSKEQRDWDKFQVLEEGHRVMCSDDGDNWVLREYIENNICRMINHNEVKYNWRYIIPIENFDFSSKDLRINCKNSIC